MALIHTSGSSNDEVSNVGIKHSGSSSFLNHKKFDSSDSLSQLVEDKDTPVKTKPAEGRSELVSSNKLDNNSAGKSLETLAFKLVPLRRQNSKEKDARNYSPPSSAQTSPNASTGKSTNGKRSKVSYFDDDDDESVLTTSSAAAAYHHAPDDGINSTGVSPHNRRGKTYKSSLPLAPTGIALSPKDSRDRRKENRRVLSPDELTTKSLNGTSALSRAIGKRDTQLRAPVLGRGGIIDLKHTEKVDEHITELHYRSTFSYGSNRKNSNGNQNYSSPAKKAVSTKI